MVEAVHVGFDFGSLHCHAAYCADGEPVALEQAAVWADTSRWIRCEPVRDPGLAVRFLSLKMLLGPGDGRSQAAFREVLFGLRRDVRKQAGKPLGHLVITVPAMYPAALRTALCDAAGTLDFREVHLLNDGMAAAIGFAGKDLRARTLLVITCGYLGMEAALIRVGGGRYRAMGYTGYAPAGGWMGDLLIMHSCRQALAAKQLWPLDRDMPTERWLTLRDTAERLKEALSSEEGVELEMVAGGDIPATVQLRFERSTYERVAGQSVAAGLDVAEKTLDAARLKATDLDEILLVGGACRAPFVSRLAGERFACRPVLLAGDVSARGAALYASELALLPAAEAAPLPAETPDLRHPELPASAASVAGAEGFLRRGEALVLGFDLPAVAPNATADDPQTCRKQVLRTVSALIARGAAQEAREFLHAMVEDAQALLDGLREAKPAGPRAEAEESIRLALEYLAAGRVLQAVENSHHAYNLDQEHPRIFQSMIEIHCRAAEMCSSRESYPEALRYLLCAQNHDLTNSDIHDRLAARHFLHARQSLEAGDRAAALQAVAECLHFQPDHEEATELKRSLESEGDGHAV